MKIKRLRINGLFYKYTVEIDMTQKGNILLGPNGVGKTTVLKILQCISDNNLLELTKWNFVSIEINTECVCDIVHRNDLRHTVEEVYKEKSFVFAQEDFFPDIDYILNEYSEYYVKREQLNYMHLYGQNNQHWSMSVDDVKRNLRTFFYDLKREGLLYKYLSTIVLGESCPEKISHVIEKNYVIIDHPVIVVLGEYLKGLVEQNYFGFVWMRQSKIESIMTADIVSETIHWRVCSGIVQENLKYLDLVQGFYFKQTEYPEAVFTSDTLDWMADCKKVLGNGIYLDEDEYQGIEDEEVRRLIAYKNELEKGYIRSVCGRVGIPNSLADIGADIIIELWKQLYESVADIKTSIKKEDRLISLQQDCIDRLQTDRVYDINKLISGNFYSENFVQEVNRKAAEFCSRVITGEIYYNWENEDIDTVPDDIFEKYKERFGLASKNDWYEMEEEARADIRVIDFIGEYLKETEVRNNIRNYIMPIVCKSLPVSPYNHMEILEKTNFYENGDDEVDSSYIFYRFYDEIIEGLMDVKNWNPKIILLEKLLNKYFEDKEVSIVPSGVKIKYKAEYFDEKVFPLRKGIEWLADINELSSGEKKVLLLLSLILFDEEMIILLDEPELSLSLVWQEDILMDMIENSEIKNFTIATHSPFMISKNTMDKYLVFLPGQEEM